MNQPFSDGWFFAFVRKRMADIWPERIETTPSRRINHTVRAMGFFWSHNINIKLIDLSGFGFQGENLSVHVDDIDEAGQ